MNFGLLHRFLLWALACSGLLVLWTAGVPHSFQGYLALGLVGIAGLMPNEWTRRPVMRRVTSIGTIAIAIFLGSRFYLNQSKLLDVALELSIWAMGLRFLSRAGANQDHQVILLSLLHIISGSVLGSGISYAWGLALYCSILPPALTVGLLRREVEANFRQGARDRSGMPVDLPRILRSKRVISGMYLFNMGIMSLPLLAFAGLCFLIIPRVGFNWYAFDSGDGAKMTGFSDSVELGSVGSIKPDMSTVLRITVPGAERPEHLALYLRGTAFDYYDGRSWHRTQNLEQPLDSWGHRIEIRHEVPEEEQFLYTVEREPLEPALLFAPLEVSSIIWARSEGLETGLETPDPVLTRGMEGLLRINGSRGKKLRYRVNSAKLVPVRLSEENRSRYLQIPKSLEGVLKKSLEEFPVDTSVFAEAVEAKLRTWNYSLDSASNGKGDPVGHFLLESHQGHCEYFSTAMVMLLRAKGIPARNVAGFSGGAYNRFGDFYSVRQADAHSWVEAWDPKGHWRRYDPTPALGVDSQSKPTIWSTFREVSEAMQRGWTENVEGYDLNQQVSLATEAKRFFSELPWRQIALVILAGLVLRLYVRHRQSDESEESLSERRVHRKGRRLAGKFLQKIEKEWSALGAARASHESPREWAERLLFPSQEAKTIAFELLADYERLRFDPRAQGLADNLSVNLARYRALTKP